jgi:5'-nucleotidase
MILSFVVCDILQRTMYKPAMKILLSNDDGFQAPGLLLLRESLKDIAETVVVAPRTNCSGFSNALTLRKSIKVENCGNGVYSVDGTPADCVHLALNGMLEFEPDLVISGINNGENMGDDTIYSGTVAAALEGRFLRLPALAVSLAGHELSYFETAVRVVHDLIDRINEHHIPGKYLLNINVPDVPYNHLSGYEITRCGKRNHSEPVIVEESQDGSGSFRIGPPGIADEAGPGTDFHAVSMGKVSITPLTNDMTHFSNLEIMNDWLHDAGN